MNMNSKQREFLEGTGFEMGVFGCRFRDFKSGLVEIISDDRQGLIINTWSSSDKSLEMAKKLNEDLTYAIEIIEQFNDLA